MRRVHRLVVVAGANDSQPGRLVGVISLSDIMRHLIVSLNFALIMYWLAMCACHPRGRETRKNRADHVAIPNFTCRETTSPLVVLEWELYLLIKCFGLSRLRKKKRLMRKMMRFLSVTLEWVWFEFMMA